MKAVGYSKSLPVTDPKVLVDFTAEKPVPGPRDLLVAVEAVSVNPVDTKVRMRAEPKPARRRRSSATTPPASSRRWAPA